MLDYTSPQPGIMTAKSLLLKEDKQSNQCKQTTIGAEEQDKRPDNRQKMTHRETI